MKNRIVTSVGLALLLVVGVIATMLLLGTSPTIARMEQIKFHQLIQPGQTFSARLDHDPDRSRIAYVLHDGDTRFASGRLVLKT